MTQKKKTAIPVEIIPNVKVTDRTPGQVARQFHGLLDNGYELRVDGQAGKDPMQLLRRGYTPKYEITLFENRFFLGNLRDVEGLKVLPAFVLPAEQGRKRRIHARVFYKDASLVWRSASHYIDTPEEDWIGKGAVKRVKVDGESRWFSAEETTNLPLEIQAALDEASRRGPRSRSDHRILSLVLRTRHRIGSGRIRTFEAPREGLATATPPTELTTTGRSRGSATAIILHRYRLNPVMSQTSTR